MKAHNIIMTAPVVLGVAVIAFGPSWGVARSFGALLLICPLMMLMMHSSHKHK